MKHLYVATILFAIQGWATSMTLQDLAPRVAGECTQPGRIICSSTCKTVLYCTRDNGELIQRPVEYCGSGAYCDSRGATCRTYLTHCSPTDTPAYQFPCTATGLYPDPYDCTVYHNCAFIGQASVPTPCRPGWGYDASTEECTLPLSSTVCSEGPVPTCTAGGQTGPVPLNRNLYYVCRKEANGVIRPDFYKCSGQGVYNSIECV